MAASYLGDAADGDLLVICKVVARAFDSSVFDECPSVRTQP